MVWKFFDRQGLEFSEDPPVAYPVGIVLPFINNSMPSATIPPSETPVGSAWLLCNGAQVSSGVYAELGELLTGNTAHPYNFTLPSMTTAFPMGGVSTSAIKTTDVSTLRSRHTHGGSSTVHNHTNSHTHSVPNHTHEVPHYHFNPAVGHTHAAGTLSLSSATNTGAIGTATAGGATVIAKGYGSGDRHKHDISGSTGESSSSIALRQTIDVAKNSGSTAASGAQSVTFNNNTISVTAPVSDILPPYLNVYFIIKAKPYSG